MDPKRTQSGTKSDEQKHELPSGDEIGGREFGQVIEPTQAQMATGNEGLTEKSVKNPAAKSKKTRKAA